MSDRGLDGYETRVALLYLHSTFGWYREPARAGSDGTPVEEDVLRAVRTHDILVEGVYLEETTAGSGTWNVIDVDTDDSVGTIEWMEGS